MGTKDAKKTAKPEAAFRTYSRGICSNNDAYVYAFAAQALHDRAKRMVEAYAVELDRWRRAGAPKDLEAFLHVNEQELKWIRRTKKELARAKETRFEPQKLRQAQYRPFARLAYYFEDAFNEDTYQFGEFFPGPQAEAENRAIAVTDAGSEKPFMAWMTNRICDMHLVGAGASCQCFPFYTYAEDGTARRENITDWGLKQFQTHYQAEVSKWDIFYYVYAVLHHPQYREHYAANLRRELPRIPFAPDFHAFAIAGKQLADLHVGYEQAKEYPLTRREKPDTQLNWRVEKMKLTRDKTSLVCNDFLTLDGIPPETFEYRLGNRSALDWVIDQYQVSTDKRSGITNDPNRPDDPQYIVRLTAQVITVSLETVKIVKSLPSLQTS